MMTPLVEEWPNATFNASAHGGGVAGDSGLESEGQNPARLRQDDGEAGAACCSVACRHRGFSLRTVSSRIIE